METGLNSEKSADFLGRARRPALGAFLRPAFMYKRVLLSGTILI